MEWRQAMKVFLILGALIALLSIALDAFGAHGLEGKLSEHMMDIYRKAVQYHMMHSLGLILVALLTERLSGTSLINWAGWVMLAGIIIFSGSLYVLSMTGISALGAITPIGGIAFLISWFLIILAAIKVL